MRLGIIKDVKEASFEHAAMDRLDFVEFCINGGDNTNEFFSQLPEIKEWIGKYKIGVGSLGRWKAYILNENGRINPEELEIAYKLIDAASYLGCPNYVCGTNYIDTLSYFENASRAIEFLSKLIERGKSMKVDISTYNCRKTNFIYNPTAWTIIHGHLKDLGIKYDPANAIYDGADYLKEAAEWGHRFYHIHLKGSLMIDGQRVDEPPAGLDQTDWRTFLSILYARKYNRGLSIEPHSQNWQGELGAKGLGYTIDYMKKLLFR